MSCDNVVKKWMRFTLEPKHADIEPPHFTVVLGQFSQLPLVVRSDGGVDILLPGCLGRRRLVQEEEGIGEAVESRQVSDMDRPSTAIL